MLTCFLLTLVALVADEPSRTWTSADGRKLEGAYVRVDGENVVIQMASGEVSVPLERLVLADRLYARKQAGLQKAEEERLAKEIPPTAAPAINKPASDDPAPNAEKENDPAPTNGDTKDGIKVERPWADIHGNRLKARFLRMHQGSVVLQGRTLKTIPFYELSDDDQAFLRKNLEALGQADQIPNRPQPQQVAGNENGVLGNGNGIVPAPSLGKFEYRK